MLINCAVYEDGVKLSDISNEHIKEHLNKAQRFVWVALKDGQIKELEKMQSEFSLHPLAIEDASRGHQRPKIEEYDDSIFAALHTLELIDDAIHVGEVAIFLGRDYILSIRNKTHEGFKNVRSRAESEPYLLKKGSSFVFYALMDEIVDRYFPIIDHLETKLENIEEAIFNKRLARNSIQQLYALKRDAMILKHATFPLLENITQLFGKGHVPLTCIENQEYFRDIYDHVYRINGSIDNILDTISTAIQVSFSMIAIEESEVNKCLAAWAAIFGIATFFVGVWGMNFKHMPELEWEYSYPTALVFIFCVCSYFYYRFKKAGWL